MAIISASDLKTHLSNITDANDDTSIAIAASAACAWVQKTCGRTFEVTTSGSESSRDYRPRSATLLVTDDFSSTVNLTVKTDNGDDGAYETTLSNSTDFWVEPLNGIQEGLAVPYYRIVCDSWLYPTCNARPSVRVTARWGWTAVPDAVKHAALLEGARLFKRRTAPEGMFGGFGEFGAVRIPPFDRDAMDELQPYIRSSTALPLPA